MNISDINQEARDLCDATATSYTATALLRRVNSAYERIIGWILEADGTWQWDDTNYTDLPIGVQTFTAGQSQYSFADKFLEIEQVEVKDIDGNWHIIKPIDQKEFSDTEPLSEAFEDDGLPEFYDKYTDDSIKFYPAPSATYTTLVDGLKIRFRRTASVYTSAEVTTGTKEPGFASPYHVLIAYMSAIPYCLTYKKDRVALYEREVERLKDGLIKHYSRRERDKRKVMTMNRRLYK